MPFFDARRAPARLESELRDAVSRVFHSGRLILGPEVEEFEREFAAFVGAPECVGVASGTDAIEIALRALALPDGGEVLCPDLTSPATATAIVRAGLEPVLVDVDDRTLTIAPHSSEGACGPRTAAVAAVHLYGRRAPVDSLLELGLPVVEDAAQAHGLGAPIGALATYSFYPTKNVGAFGDGGAVVTADAGLANRLRRLRQYGEHPRYCAQEIGLNSRLDELQAALLRVRLRGTADENTRRREIADAYDAALGRRSPAGVNHLYVVRVRDRDAFRRRLDERGIDTAVHYPYLLSQQPAFSACRRADDLAVAQRAVGEVVSLPCFGDLTSEEERRVAAALSELRDDVLER